MPRFALKFTARKKHEARQCVSSSEGIFCAVRIVILAIISAGIAEMSFKLHAFVHDPKM